MSGGFEDVVTFDVVSLNAEPIALHTFVEHAVVGNRDLIRIVQTAGPEGGEDVILLDRTDFENITKILKGH